MLLPERHHDGAGQRRQIDHELRLEAVVAVPQRVGQHEAPLGVGVEHLDRLARHRGDDVARTLGVAVDGMFSTQADDADGIDLGLARGQRVHQAGDGGGAAHVALHVLHAGGRLDRDAAGVEHDALADEGNRPCPLPCRRSTASPTSARRRAASLARRRAARRMPSFFMSFSVRISTSTPSFSSSLARAANSTGPSTLAGSLTRSRASMHAVGHRLGVGERLLRRRRVGAMDGDAWPALASALPSPFSFLVLYLSKT